MGCESVVVFLHTPPESVNTLPRLSPATQVVVQESAVNEPSELNAAPVLDHWSTIGAPFGSCVILSVRSELRTFQALKVTTYLMAFLVRFAGKIAGTENVESEHVDGKFFTAGLIERLQCVALIEEPVNVTRPPAAGTATALAAKAVADGAVEAAPAAVGSKAKELIITVAATTWRSLRRERLGTLKTTSSRNSLQLRSLRGCRTTGNCQRRLSLVGRIRVRDPRSRSLACGSQRRHCTRR